MKSIRTLVFLSAMLPAVGVMGAQAGPAQRQQGQPPQAQVPQQPAQPNAQTPQGQPPAQPHRPTIDEQVQMLTQDLDLSPEQQAKMRNILEEQHQQAMTIVDDSTMTRDEKIQKIRALREVTIAKARTILNSDQQQKLDNMLNATPQVPNGQRSPGSNPPAGTAPPPGATPPPASRPPIL